MRRIDHVGDETLRRITGGHDDLSHLQWCYYCEKKLVDDQGAILRGQSRDCDAPLDSRNDGSYACLNAAACVTCANKHKFRFQDMRGRFLCDEPAAEGSEDEEDGGGDRDREGQRKRRRLDVQASEGKSREDLQAELQIRCGTVDREGARDVLVRRLGIVNDLDKKGHRELKSLLAKFETITGRQQKKTMIARLTPHWEKMDAEDKNGVVETPYWYPTTHCSLAACREV